MSTAERIIHEMSELRPDKLAEVLEFVEFLKDKENRKEENAFREASLSSAMRGLENEEDLYFEADITEKLR